MARRIRSIKPEILEDEEVAALSDGAWRLWVSLWTLADDEGRLRGSAEWILAQVFWSKKLARTVEDVEKLLEELAGIRKIQRYVVNGQHYLKIVNWEIHQKIDHPTKSKLPPPPPLEKPREASRNLAPDLDLDLDRKGEDRKPPRFSEVWEKQYGPTASAGDLLEASELCVRAEVNPAEAIAEYEHWRSECPPEKRPSPAPIKFVQHFGRVLERLKRRRSGQDRAATPATQELIAKWRATETAPPPPEFDELKKKLGGDQ